jgi:hypothetical protein
MTTKPPPDVPDTPPGSPVNESRHDLEDSPFPRERVYKRERPIPQPQPTPRQIPSRPTPKK